MTGFLTKIKGWQLTGRAPAKVERALVAPEFLLTGHSKVGGCCAPLHEQVGLTIGRDPSALMLGTAASLLAGQLPAHRQEAVEQALKQWRFDVRHICQHYHVVSQTESHGVQGLVTRDGASQRAYFAAPAQTLLPLCGSIWDETPRPVQGDEVNHIPEAPNRFVWGLATAPVQNGECGEMTYLGALVLEEALDALGIKALVCLKEAGVQPVAQPDVRLWPLFQEGLLQDETAGWDLLITHKVQADAPCLIPQDTDNMDFSVPLLTWLRLRRQSIRLGILGLPALLALLGCPTPAGMAAMAAVMACAVGACRSWAIDPAPVRWPGWRMLPLLALAFLLPLASHLWLRTVDAPHAAAGMAAVLIGLCALLPLALGGFRAWKWRWLPLMLWGALAALLALQWGQPPATVAFGLVCGVLTGVVYAAGASRQMQKCS